MGNCENATRKSAAQKNEACSVIYFCEGRIDRGNDTALTRLSFPALVFSLRRKVSRNSTAESRAVPNYGAIFAFK
jgi:hypothetical protein